MSFFLSFLLVLSVLTNALPSNLIESSIDENSISIGSNDLTDAGCIRRTSYDFPNEGLEDDLYLVRRQSGTKSNSCPVNIQAPKLQPPRKVETPKWRAPKVLPQVELDVPKGNPRDPEFCEDSTRPLLVSCTGPEVWYYSSGRRSHILVYVLNCIDGKFLNDYNYNTAMADSMIIQGHINEIPARGPYPAAEETNKYCCHSHLAIDPLYAAYRCTYLPPQEFVPLYWEYDALNSWLDSGMPADGLLPDSGF